MRTLVLLFVLAAPSLMFCCAAHAAAPADIGKPVCARYDGASSKAADARQSPVASGTSTSAVAGGSSTSSTLAPTAKSGGSASDMRAHNAPRWQAFLPGMFR